MFSLQIPKRNRQCLKCEKVFIAEMAYFSLLKPSDEGFVREDFCLVCQESENSATTYWQGKVPKEKEVVEVSQDREQKALTMFKELSAGKTVEEQQDAFILALYLVRQKIIALRQQKPQFNLYEILETEEMIAIPHFKSNQINVADIQKRLVAKLI